MILPVHLEGQTIRDAYGRVVVSAINPCNMAERRMIVKALNNLIGGRSHGKSANGEAPSPARGQGAVIPSVAGETAKTESRSPAQSPRRNRQCRTVRCLPPALLPPAAADGVDCVMATGG